MRLAVLGAGGMLGSALMKALTDNAGHLTEKYSDAFGFTHEQLDILSPTEIEYQLRPYDVVINCAGKPNQASPVNSLGPRYLAQVLNHAKILHISTDCVFGATSKSPFTVDAKPIPDSNYGISKLAGEVRGNENFTSIRTSFIGPKHGLLRWFLDADARARTGEKVTLEGWARALWTGSTVGAVANGIIDMLDHLDTLGEVEHLATDGILSKYDVLIYLREYYKSDMRITKTYAVEVNRVLEHSFELDPIAYRVEELLSYAQLGSPITT